MPFGPGHNEPLPLLGMCIKNHTPTIPSSSPLKAWKVTIDATMPSFNVISIRSTPEIVLSFIKELQESEDERRAKLDDKI